MRNELKLSEEKSAEKDKIIENLEKESKKRIMLTKNYSAEENVETSSSSILLKDEIFKNVLPFVKPKELFSLFHTSRTTINAISRNRNILQNLFKNAITTKNNEIRKLINRDFNRDYDIDDKELEKLMKEYIMNKKVPGKELRGVLNSSFNYIDKDIKRQLGMPMQEGKKSIFGSYELLI